MNKLYINIHHSNLQIYETNKKYEITAIKSIGNGGYGYIFLTNQYDVIKIIPENPNESRDDYYDFSEEIVVQKIIENKNNFKINNNKYAIGKIINKNDLSQERSFLLKTIHPMNWELE